jgi:hypothetical protein
MDNEEFELIEIDEDMPVETSSRKKPKKSLLQRLWNNILNRNMLYACAGFIILIFVINFLLKVGTLHGKSFPVPDFTGMQVSEAMALAHEQHLRLEVSDSVFVPHRQRGSIFRQIPEPYEQVKKGRRVLLIINALSPRKVTVPDVVGYSLRQAKAVLSSQGLSIGRLRYVPDIATNSVLDQLYQGFPIESNAQLNAGSEIDLLLGLSQNGRNTTIPYVIGLIAETAKDVLLDNSLNASLHFDRNITNYADSLSARVYRQSPSASMSMIWPLGTKIEVYLKLDDDEERKKDNKEY